ncbi:MAG: hypothetical protein ACM3ON_14225 [Chloroflexota bacterium]
MRYLIVCLLLVPSLVFAAQKGKYAVKCEDISGGECKKECSADEKKIKQIQISEGEQGGKVAVVDCSESGKEFVCCVEKKKIKE